MITLKQLNDHIKSKYRGFDIELVKGDGYFYFDGDDGFDKMPSIYCTTLNGPTRERWHEMIDDAFHEAEHHITSELRDVERMITVMLESYESNVDERTKKFADEPQRFFEWDITTTWADVIVRDELRLFDRILRAAADATPREIMTAAARTALTFAVRRSERKIETSSYEAREAQSIAHEKAYARLCAMFEGTRAFVRKYEPEMYNEHLNQIERAITRGF